MIKIKTTRPVGARIADIGAGGREYNIRTVDMNKLFPTIPAGAPVPCFNCSGPLIDQSIVPETAPKRGQWRAYCKACDMFTFFDKA
jgi:hypothetical protein